MTTTHLRSVSEPVTTDKKKKEPPVPLLIDDSEAVLEIAKKLIPKHHPHLIQAKFLYLCRNRASKAAGNPVAGQVRKANPTEKHLAQKAGDDGADFVVTVALDVWNELEPTQRTALVDHLLSRCVGIEDDQTGDMKYSLRPPQVQEFPEVAERHGKWNDGLVKLGDSLEGK